MAKRKKRGVILDPEERRRAIKEAINRLDGTKDRELIQALAVFFARAISYKGGKL